MKVQVCGLVHMMACTEECDPNEDLEVLCMTMLSSSHSIWLLNEGPWWIAGGHAAFHKWQVTGLGSLFTTVL